MDNLEETDKFLNAQPAETERQRDIEVEKQIEVEMKR